MSIISRVYSSQISSHANIISNRFFVSSKKHIGGQLRPIFNYSNTSTNNKYDNYRFQNNATLFSYQPRSFFSTSPKIYGESKKDEDLKKILPVNTDNNSSDATKKNLRKLLIKTWKERWFGISNEEQKQATFGEVFRLLKLGRRDLKLFTIAMILLCLSAATIMSLPKITGSILDATKNFTDIDSVVLYGFSLDAFLGIMAGLLLISTFATYARIIIMRVIGENLVSRLRSRFMKKTLSQDMEFYDKNKVGDLISRLSSDAYVVSKSITQNMSDGIKHTIVGASSVTMMFLLSTKLSLILLAFGPPLVFASYIYGMKIRAISRQLQQATGALTKVSEEQLNAIKTIQSFTAEVKEVHRYDNRIREVWKISYKDAVTNATFFATTGILGNVTFLLTLGLGTHFVMNGVMTVGDLTAYLIYTEYCGSATFGIANFYTELFKGAGAASRLFEMLDLKSSIDPIHGKKLLSSKGNIKFDNVTFAYPSRPNNIVFKDLSFEIKPGSNVCIVGPSGRGKSTIASLLLRFYNPSSGKILIDGEDISQYSVHSLRQLLGFVQQEPVLIEGSIAENIVYGLPKSKKVTMDMIEWVAAKSNCDFIYSLPEKFNTNIGARGSLLSGGQKQKIAIARCLIKDPPILILDEATSALDSKSENAINTTLSRLMKDHAMTTISIAHRLSTIERCEDILVLGYNGKIVEQGKFRDLFSDKQSHLYKLLNEPKKEDKKSGKNNNKTGREGEDDGEGGGEGEGEGEGEAGGENRNNPENKQDLEHEKSTKDGNKESTKPELKMEHDNEEELVQNSLFRQKMIIPDHFDREKVIMKAAMEKEEQVKEEVALEAKKKNNQHEKEADKALSTL